MVWTSPMTFSSGAVLTAAQLNTHLRDNLNETAPGKATTAGRIFVSTGANAIAERVPTSARVNTSNTTASAGTYVDLGTVGPSVTVTTGTRAIIFLTAEMSNSSASGATLMGTLISGASAISPSTGKSLRTDDNGAGTETNRATAVIFEDGLTAGSNTFKAQYMVGSGGTGTFAEREILVIPL